ncbi:MAG: aminoacyl-tRNA deacylase [Gemmatimonadota bacterium]
MSMPSRLAHFLDQHGARYEIRSHAHSRSSAETARTAHVEPHQLAKSVILEDELGCVMAVVPGDARVSVGAIARLLGRDSLHLSDEARISELFADCDLGAVPAIGMAWGMETVVDEEVEANPDVYFEAGDHEMLLRMTSEEFRATTRDARRGRISRRVMH